MAGGFNSPAPWTGISSNPYSIPVIAPVAGGGESRRRIEAPGRRTTYEIARFEDEEIIAVLQAMLSRRH